MDASAVVRVVDKLSKLIYQEANYLGGFRDAVEWLNTELHRIQCFLKDAEPKGRKGDERVKNWVREIRDVAYEIEDLIDIIGAASKRKNHRRRKRTFVGLASRYATAPFDYYSRHHLLCGIDRIKEKMVEISRSREIFGVSNFGGSSDPDRVDVNFPTPLLASPDFEDDVHLVGFEEDKELLVRHLIDQQNQWRSFVSVVGMGGLGKTTLAKKVYHDPRVRRRFDVLCWVTVSKNYRGAEFLNCIIEKVMGCTGEELLRMRREELERKLDQQFQERRCLIVLDDVWLSSTCEDLKRLFPDHNNGSRVLLTTRSVDVARSADPSFAPHIPRFLDDDESWELLQKKAFPSRRGHERSCPGDLEEVGRKLAKNCHGLPLALVVLGSLLFKKGPFPATWSQVFESLDWEFMEDGNKCFDILALSYDDDLPDDSFRSCFLYISSFPEGSEIFVPRLIERRAWGAFPPNLTKLVLNRFEFLQDPMEELEKLRHLVDLQILAPEVGHHLVVPDYKVITCSAGGFPRLQHLQLYGLKVEEWRIEASAMRSLTSLTMISMVKLRKVPEGLQHIATLRELAFNDMSRDFYRRIKASEGEDWQFISHVPSVSIQEGFMKIWLSDSFPSQQLKAFIFSRKAAKEFIMGGRSSNVPEQLQLELLASEDSPGVLDETDTVIEGR